MLRRLWAWLTHERQHRNLLDEHSGQVNQIFTRDLHVEREITLLEGELTILHLRKRDAPPD